MSETTYADAREAIENALYKHNIHGDMADIILSHLAKVQPAATGAEVDELRDYACHLPSCRCSAEEANDEDCNCGLTALLESNRKARPAAEREGEAVARLRELVELRDLHGRAELALYDDHSTGADYDRLNDEYQRRVKPAWERARHLLSATPAPQPAAPVTATGRVHELKVWPAYFDALMDGRKTFEWRKEDRGFGVGDVLRLREWSPDPDGGGGGYTGREVRRTVTYWITGPAFGIPEGYCILALAAAPVEVSEAIRRLLATLKPAGHSGDEESGRCDEDCKLCAWSALAAALECQRGGK